MGEITSRPVQTTAGPPGETEMAANAPLGSDARLSSQARAADSLVRSADSPVAVAYVIQSGFGKAVRTLRDSLKAGGLEVVSETDIADTVRTTLGMDLAPSKVLSVASPFLLLQAAVAEPALLTVLPFHVVAISKEQWTHVYVLNPMRLGSETGGAFGPKLHELSFRIRQCLDHIAARIPSVRGW